MTEHLRHHYGTSRLEAREQRGRAARRGPDPRPGAALDALPARVLGRDAPAHRDRRGADVRADVCSLRTSRPPRSTSPCRRASFASSIGCAATARSPCPDHARPRRACRRSPTSWRSSTAVASSSKGRRPALLSAPRHPYTQGLLDALPHPELARGSPLRGIPGPPAQPGELPTGCVFHPRCDYADRHLHACTAPETCASETARSPAPSTLRRVSALEINALGVAYPRRGHVPVQAVVDASIDVGSGEIVGLVGESGCGKSTLARAAVGLIAPTAGTIVLEGRELAPLTRRARQRHDARLQMVFQNPYASLNPAPADRAPDRRLAGHPRARRPRGAPHACARAARARRAAGERRLAVPARVQRWPAAADRDRPRARGGAVGARPRRAALVARCVRPGADREPARQPRSRTRARVAADLARPRHRPSGRRPRLRDVPRRDRRGGADGRRLVEAACTRTPRL